MSGFADATAFPRCNFQVNDFREDIEWDDFVRSTAGGHHVQTSYWAIAKQAIGWTALRVILRNGSRIVGGSQLLIRKCPVIGNVSYVTKGPLLADQDPQAAHLLIARLLQFAAERKIRLLSVQPPNDAQYICDILKAHGFRRSSIELSPVASILVDLSKDPSALLNLVRRQTRQNIRRGLQAGIRVEEGDSNDVKQFYRLYCMTGDRQKFLPYPQRYYESMMSAFERHERMRLLFAKYKEEPVSVLLLVLFRDTVIAKIFGWSGRYRELRPNEALFWGSILWAKEQGYRTFDLEGIDRDGAEKYLRNEPLPEALSHCPDQLKYGFGGQVVLYPETYELFSSRFLRLLSNITSPAVGKRNLASRLIDVARKRA